MYAKILTASLYGLETETTWIEVDAENGLPAFSIVGLANLSIKEAKDRIHSAILNCGYSFPPKRITVNLTPASRKKEGSHYDLGIALGLLCSTSQLFIEENSVACFGELRLDGKISGIEGALPMIIGLQKRGINRILLPFDNFDEARLVKGVELIPVKNLKEAADFLSGFSKIKPFIADGLAKGAANVQVPDFGDIRGQLQVKRAAQLAAAGRHGLLMIGPPGVGKSMVGKRIPGIMPDMEYEEMLDVTRIYSIAGELNPQLPMIIQRPYRAPHHSLSAAALIGGGSVPKPGEISLAHKGVLFLDELPEFSVHTLDTLRQPLEEAQVSIVRVNGKCLYPADFMLVAAMNPCRCGYFGDPIKPCNCSKTDRKRYVGRISGPLLDRIDIHVVMERTIYEDLNLSSNEVFLDSKTLKSGVEKAVAMQKERYKNLEIDCNARLNPALIKKFCELDKESDSIMKQAFSHLNLSARSYHRVLRLSRTIADTKEQEKITPEDILESLSYRMSEKYF